MAYKTGNPNADAAANTLVTGGELPDPGAAIDMQATDKGLLIPRLNTGQRDGLIPFTGYFAFHNGNNSLGEGATGDTVSPVLTPTLIETAGDWALAEAGWYGGYFINGAGELWFTGWDTEGTAGQGFVAGVVTSLVQVGSATDWVSATQGEEIGYFINSLGELWGAGFNGNGQMGQGFFGASYSSLVQIGSSTNWVKAEAGRTSGYFINSLGELWCLGRNSSGQLGQGDGLAVNVLTQIGTATNWTQVSSYLDTMYLVNSLGELWGAGKNDFGQLGLNNTINPQNVLVQIGASTNWVNVFAASDFVYALDSSGALYATGLNSAGQLGRGTQTFNEITLAQVESQTNWVAAAGGNSFGRFLNSSGQLWGIGENFSGQLGLGHNSSVIIPMAQSGSATNWAKLSASDSAVYALKTTNT